MGRSAVTRRPSACPNRPARGLRPGVHLSALPYCILRRLSRPRSTALRIAPGRSGGVAAAGGGPQPSQRARQPPQVRLPSRPRAHPSTPYAAGSSTATRFPNAPPPAPACAPAAPRHGGLAPRAWGKRPPRRRELLLRAPLEQFAWQVGRRAGCSPRPVERLTWTPAPKIYP